MTGARAPLAALALAGSPVAHLHHSAIPADRQADEQVVTQRRGNEESLNGNRFEHMPAQHAGRPARQRGTHRHLRGAPPNTPDRPELPVKAMSMVAEQSWPPITAGLAEAGDIDEGMLV